MVILGLTGSIGMGKSTAAGCFRQLGVPVYDADAEIHKLLGRGGAAIELVGAVFPDVIKDGAVDRPALGARAFEDAAALRKLESILHPMVREVQRKWLSRMALRREPIVVLDIPLLFETGGERNCDAVVVVSVPKSVQARRVLRRPGMTWARFEAILAKQTPDAEKRRRADFILNAMTGKRDCLLQAAEIVKLAKRLPARNMPHGRRPRRRRQPKTA